MRKKNIARPIIPLRFANESINVSNSVFKDGILLKSLSGLRSLMALNAGGALNDDPP